MSTAGLFFFLSFFLVGGGGGRWRGSSSPQSLANCCDLPPTLPHPRGPELPEAPDSQHVMQLGFVLKVSPTFYFIAFLNPHFIVITIITTTFFSPFERFPLLRSQICSLFTPPAEIITPTVSCEDRALVVPTFTYKTTSIL